MVRGVLLENGGKLTGTVGTGLIPSLGSSSDGTGKDWWSAEFKQ
jgi:hypothetical protein